MLALVVMVVVSACSRQADDNSSAAVAKLSHGLQQGVLVRAIRDAGLACREVRRAQRLPDQGGEALWRARCEDGTEHLVTIGVTGTATVLSRDAAERTARSYQRTPVHQRVGAASAAK